MPLKLTPTSLFEVFLCNLYDPTRQIKDIRTVVSADLAMISMPADDVVIPHCQHYPENIEIPIWQATNSLFTN